MTTYIQMGDAIDYTPTVDITAGDVVVEGDMVAIAKISVPANTLGALAPIGVHQVPKAVGGGEAIPWGVRVFWDATNKVATTSDGSGANKYMGKTVIAAGDNDPTTRVRLSQ